MMLSLLLFVLPFAASMAAPFNKTATGACSATDQASISVLPAGTADGSFPKTTSDCAHHALNILHGIDETKFNTCLTGAIASVSTGCSDCFWQAAQYGFEHCKLDCISSWCSSSCLTCSAGFDATGCAGFTAPAPTPC